MISEFNLEGYASLDLPSLYAVLLTDRRQSLRTFLKEVYSVRTYDSRYDILRQLDAEFLYTTNIDDLPFHIFNARSDELGRALHDNYLYGAPRQPSEVMQYIALHGSVVHEDSDFLFTAGQISAAFASDRETWYVFQRELQSRPTLFLGYGMRDAGVLQALHDTASKDQSNRWILIRRSDEASADLFKNLGFHVLIGDTEDFLEYLTRRTIKTGSQKVSLKHPRIGSVPLLTQVARRPIRSFFIGAEPEWSDAYSTQVVKRGINSDVKNSIYSGRHAAIVGLPLSGKTTILKQVACEVAAENNVLYFNKLSDVQVQKILAEYVELDQKLIIFVDNLLDSIDAVDVLVRQIGAQIVCAEQSLYFDSVRLPVLSKMLDVHSASEISGQDLQRIIDSIPGDIRRWNLNSIEDVEEDSGELGLFEAFRRHVFDESLTDRFRIKLSEFEARDSEAFDVYIMACYVASCRTIVSFDMIYMFMSKKNKVYTDIYRVLERIDSFLVDVELADDAHQDYFSVRSGALAKIALKECSSQAFSRIYERFHSSVPAKIIVDYPVFRRYGYDNDFARRAYPTITDGLAFYERLVKLTDNPYDYQHGAIYLSRLKGFTAAFSWIDTALSKSKGKIFSIRNTHARILFDANIEILQNDNRNVTALNGISESMEVLKSCIEGDVLRSYHLLRFSDQALRFSKINQDLNAVRWLTNAKDLLAVMVDQATKSNSRESYNLRKYRSLHSQVRSALTSCAIES